MGWFVEQRQHVDIGKAAAVTSARMCANIAGEVGPAVIAARMAFWMARDAPAGPRTSTIPGLGPRSCPRATACRTFSCWVPRRRCPGWVFTHNRTSQSCRWVDPSGNGPNTSADTAAWGVITRPPLTRTAGSTFGVVAGVETQNLP